MGCLAHGEEAGLGSIVLQYPALQDILNAEFLPCSC